MKQAAEAGVGRTVAELEHRLAASHAERDELLQQQAASAEILKVINTSPGDLTPVFDIILEKAHSLCDAPCGSLQLYDGDHTRAVAVRGMTDAFEKFLRQGYRITNRIQGTQSDRPVQIDDLAVALAQIPDDASLRAGVELGGIRTMLSLPLVKDGVLFGRIVAGRKEVLPFSEHQIALLQSFAAQAVIAIENARLLTGQREALEQQTATADILKVIASSPDDVQPVFQAIAERSNRLVSGLSTTVLTIAGETVNLSAFTPTNPAADAALTASFPRQLSALPWSQHILRGEVFCIPDTEADEYMQRIARLRGYRSMLFVPLVGDGVPIGMIGQTKVEPGAFADSHVRLLQTFADQAVIAIQNVRLFNETKEALEQQTATSEVLEVISSSPGELKPVFQKMLENATRVCGAHFGIMNLWDGNKFNTTAAYNVPPAFAALRLSTPIHPQPQTALFAILETRRPVHVHDVRTGAAYLAGVPNVVEMADVAGARTVILVPLLKEDELIGTITIYRQEVRPFTDKQIALLENFTKQAVIAIENTRLLRELRERTDDLTESLEQQTATSEVLEVISSSPGELAPVFQKMLENATRVCGAHFGIMQLWDGENFSTDADYNVPPAFAALRRNRLIRPHPLSGLSIVVKTHQAVHTHDVRNAPAYLAGVPNVVELAHVGGARTLIAVPMLKEGELMGAITIFRQEVKPFTDKQIALLENFTKQAVIAIENTRLLRELRERTDDLTRSLDDLRAAQDRLVQTEKLASLGQLTAGIAHEIKNPLNFVNNFSALSVELIDELDEALAPASLDQKTRGDVSELTAMLKGNLEKVVQHGKRADSIVKNMLLHSREGSGEHRASDINAIVDESLNLAYHGARAERPGFNITLRRDLDPDAGMIELYPQEISRVLLNLISNGFYAANKRKEAADGTFEPLLTATTKSLGNRVEIRIRDNGTGIPLEVKEKMFNPFFTTKPAGEGTGLGLSMSHDIVVKQHGGTIDVDTEPGVFTEFIITLPRKGAAKANIGGKN